ncbi:MAG: hypothetical protein WD042_07630 [Phycisphaeraceae bacterium]
MRRTKMQIVAMVVAVAALPFLLVDMAMSQPAGGQQPDARQRGGDGERGRFDPEQMRQRMNERMKEALGASDEEWKVLQPRVEKVTTLQRDARGSGFAGRRRGGPEADAANQPPQTPVAKAAEELRTTLEDDKASNDVIKAKLEALRKARADAKVALEAAQKDLREIVSLRQEAQLVSMGILE